jgi:AcrR family transcriptional regulator
VLGEIAMLLLLEGDGRPDPDCPVSQDIVGCVDGSRYDTVSAVPDQRSETAAAARPRVDAILEAACRVVVREGAHGLRMATVAAEAGVSKALVHYYFTTRQELLRSAIVFAETHLAEALTEELGTLGTGREKVERALLAGVEATPPYSDQRSLWNEVWSGLRYDDELRPLVTRFYADWLERFTTLIAEGKADGSIPATVDERSAGMRLAAIADGIDSMLYLGIVDHAGARALAAETLTRELS